jgi:hypothetical protein
VLSILLIGDVKLGHHRTPGSGYDGS